MEQNSHHHTHHSHKHKRKSKDLSETAEKDETKVKKEHKKHSKSKESAEKDEHQLKETEDSTVEVRKEKRKSRRTPSTEITHQEINEILKKKEKKETEGAISKLKRSISGTFSKEKEEDSSSDEEDKNSSSKQQYKKMNVMFIVNLVEIRKLPIDDAGKKFILSWKRGKTRDKSQKIYCTATGVLTINHNMTFLSNLKKSPTTGVVLEKNLLFILKKESKGKFVVAANAVLNLADFSKNISQKAQKIQLPLSSTGGTTLCELVMEVGIVHNCSPQDLVAQSDEGKSNSDLLKDFIESEEKRTRSDRESDNESMTGSEVSSAWSVIEDNPQEEDPFSPHISQTSFLKQLNESQYNSNNNNNNNQAENNILTTTTPLHKDDNDNPSRLQGRIKIVNLDLLGIPETTTIDYSFDQHRSFDDRRIDGEESITVKSELVSKVSDNDLLQLELDLLKAEKESLDFENREKKQLLSEIQQYKDILNTLSESSSEQKKEGDLEISLHKIEKEKIKSDLLYAKEQLSKTEQEFRNSKENEENLKRQNDQLIEELAQLKNSQSKLQATHDQLKEEYQRSQSQIQTLNSTSSQLSKEIEVKDQSLLQARTEYEQLQYSFEEAKSQLQGELVQSSSLLQSLQSEYSAVKSTLVEANDHLSKSQEANLFLQKENQKLASDRQKLLDHSEALTEEIEKFKARYSKLTSQYELSIEEYRKLNEKNKKLLDIYENLQSDYDSLQQKFTQLEIQKQQISERSEKCERTMEELHSLSKEKIAAFELQYQSQVSQNSQLSSEIKDLKDVVRTQRDQITKLEQNIVIDHKKYQADLDLLHAKINNLEDSVSQRDKLLEKSKSEYHDLIHKLDTDKDTLTRDLQTSLEVSIQSKDQEISKITQSNFALSQKNNELTSKLEKLENGFIVAENNRKSLVKQFNQCTLSFEEVLKRVNLINLQLYDSFLSLKNDPNSPLQLLPSYSSTFVPLFQNLEKNHQITLNIQRLFTQLDTKYAQYKENKGASGYAEGECFIDEPVPYFAEFIESIDQHNIMIDDSFVIGSKQNAVLSSGLQLENSQNKSDLLVYRNPVDLSKQIKANEFYHNILNHLELETKNLFGVLSLVSDQLNEQNQEKDALSKGNKIQQDQLKSLDLYKHKYAEYKSKFLDLETQYASLQDQEKLQTRKYQELETQYATLQESQKLQTRKYNEIETQYATLQESQKLQTIQYHDLELQYAELQEKSKKQSNNNNEMIAIKSAAPKIDKDAYQQFLEIKSFLKSKGIEIDDSAFFDYSQLTVNPALSKKKQNYYDYDEHDANEDDQFGRQLFESEMAKRQLDSIALQMIVDSVYNATLLSDIKGYSDALYKSLFLMNSAPWAKRQFSRIKVAFETCYLRSRSDIESLIFYLALSSSLLDKLQSSLSESNSKVIKESDGLNTGILGAFHGPYVCEEGVIPPDCVESDNALEGQLQCLVFDIYSAVLSYFESQLNLMGKAAVFTSSSLAQKQSGLDFNPFTIKHLIKLFEDPFNTAIQCKLIPIIVKQIYIANYYYLNALVFHEILENVELCNANGGIQIKAAASYLTTWYLNYASERYIEALSATENQLSYMTQAANFFITISNEKVFPTLDAIKTTFPLCNLAQLKHFLDMNTASGFQIPVPQKVRNEIDSACERERLGALPLYLPPKLTLNDISALT